jgi:hypothetical protein
MKGVRGKWVQERRIHHFYKHAIYFDRMLQKKAIFESERVYNEHTWREIKEYMIATRQQIKVHKIGQRKGFEAYAYIDCSQRISSWCC